MPTASTSAIPTATCPIIRSGARRSTRSELARAAREDGQAVEELDEPALIERVADELAAGRIVGWMDGASEFGPRALGHRSILAAPHSREMRDRLNRDIKYREEFRPFAPVVADRGRRPLFRAAAAAARGWRASCRASFRCGPNGASGSRRSRTSTARRACRRSSAAWRRALHALLEAYGRRSGHSGAAQHVVQRRRRADRQSRARRLFDVPALRHRRARRRDRRW